MLLNFNEMKEITMPGMNDGTGMMSAKLYMDEQRKIIPCSIHPGGSIGMHTHETSDILSGTGKAVCDGIVESLSAGTCLCKELQVFCKR